MLCKVYKDGKNSDSMGLVCLGARKSTSVLVWVADVKMVQYVIQNM